jgi:hypothetical protein
MKPKVHKIREEYAKRFDNNLEAIYNDASKKQGRDGRRVVLACPKQMHVDISEIKNQCQH